MSVANLYEGSDPSNWSKTFAGLLEDFMKLAPNVSRFRADVKVKAKLRQLKANDRTQVPDLSATCGQLS